RAPVQGLAADMDSAAAQRQLAALDAAHTAYPVLDAAGIPLGWIRHAQALAWGAEDIARRPRLRDMVAGQVPALAYPGELGSAIADRMAGGGPSRVAVVDRESGRMLGMVARSDLFIARQRRLIEESIRQAPLRRRQAE
ncbi:CBS domain protein, partial [Bordetella hinzii CA90 BAL1384]